MWGMQNATLRRGLQVIDIASTTESAMVDVIRSNARCVEGTDRLCWFGEGWLFEPIHNHESLSFTIRFEKEGF